MPLTQQQILAKLTKQLVAQLEGADNWTEQDWKEFQDECGEGEES